MKAKKVLYITQEIAPYVADNEISLLGRQLPQTIQSSGHEIRTFMPRWGIINERRNQLHEVIRLSGLNIIIDDTDHQLIIKVASIQAARMQVYFIDNDEYFHKRGILGDEAVSEYTDNGERAVFYARGVLETVKKLRWTPDVIHCHGWISAIVPFFIKTAYADDTSFLNTKVVFSAYGDAPKLGPAPNFGNCLDFRSANASLLESVGLNPAEEEILGKLAVAYSDGYVQTSDAVSPTLLEQANKLDIPTLINPEGTDYEASYGAFYEKVCE